MNKPFNPETLEGQYYNALYALIEKKSPKIASSVIDELNNQRSSLKLIASENYSFFWSAFFGFYNKCMYICLAC